VVTCIGNPIIHLFLAYFAPAIELDHSTIPQVNAAMIVGISIFISFSGSIFIGNIPTEVMNELSNPKTTDTESQYASMQTFWNNMTSLLRDTSRY
jgi:hypothetical protein